MTILDVEVVFQLAPRYATILARQLNMLLPQVMAVYRATQSLGVKAGHRI